MPARQGRRLQPADAQEAERKRQGKGGGGGPSREGRREGPPETDGTTDSGQRTTDNGQRTTDSGQRTTDNGQRTTDSGQRTADSGRAMPGVVDPRPDGAEPLTRLDHRTFTPSHLHTAAPPRIAALPVRTRIAAAPPAGTPLRSAPLHGATARSARRRCASRCAPRGP